MFCLKISKSFLDKKVFVCVLMFGLCWYYQIGRPFVGLVSNLVVPSWYQVAVLKLSQRETTINDAAAKKMAAIVFRSNKEHVHPKAQQKISRCSAPA